MRALVSAGTTVLLTTQYLEEADQLADRIAVINQGKIIAEGTSSELKASVGTGTLHVSLLDSEDRERAVEVLTNILKVPIHFSSDPASLVAYVDAPSLAAEALLEFGREEIGIRTFSLGQPSLDEVFLTLTNQAVAEEQVSEEARA